MARLKKRDPCSWPPASIDKGVFEITMPAPKQTASKRVAIEAKR
jgi:hypothetical protein